MEALVEYLRTHVPLTRFIDIHPGICHQGFLTLEAPLAPNLNDKQTAFGGSLATLCTLSGWAMISTIAREQGHDVDIVIAASEIRYLRPVSENLIVARADRPHGEQLEKFALALESTGWGTLTIDSVVQDGGIDAVRFTGKYGARRI